MKLDIYAVCALWLSSVFLFSCTNEPYGQEKQTPTASSPVLIVQSGVKEDGHPTAAWIEAIRGRHDEAKIASLQEEQKYLSPEELICVDLIKSKVTTWPGRKRFNYCKDYRAVRLRKSGAR